MNRYRPATVPSGHTSSPHASSHCCRRAKPAHQSSTSTTSCAKPAATAAAEKVAPATLPTSSTRCSIGLRRSSCCSSICRRLSGTLPATAATSPRSVHPPSAGASQPRRTQSSTTVTMKSGLPSVRWWVVFQKWRWTEIDGTLGPVLRVSSRKERPMTFVTVHCPHCDSEQIVKRGKTRRGTQRYLCQNTACITGSFLLDYRNRGCLPEVKQQIVDMSLNASGVRDTARSLHISPTTVLSELKKKEVVLEAVNTAVLRT